MSKLFAHQNKGHARIHAQLNLQITREDDCFVVYCPDLELSSHGDTPEEAKKNFAEVLDIFFDDITERGTLAEVLQECGWTFVENEEEPLWVPPAIIARETYSLDRKV